MSAALSIVPAPVIRLDPPKGTYRLLFRRSGIVRDFPSEFAMAAWLDAEYGVRGWEEGSDRAGFEDFTIRDDEGEILAELENY